MKKTILIGAMSAIFFSSFAMAAGKQINHGAKKSHGEKINFHELIVDSSLEKAEKSLEFDERTFAEEDQKKVVADFYDVEIGIGVAPKVGQRLAK